MKKEKLREVMAEQCGKWLDQWCDYFKSERLPFNEFRIVKLETGQLDYAFMPTVNASLDTDGNPLKAPEEQAQKPSKKKALADQESQDEVPEDELPPKASKKKDAEVESEDDEDEYE